MLYNLDNICKTFQTFYNGTWYWLIDCLTFSYIFIVGKFNLSTTI